MAAIFDTANPSSPLAFHATQTALMLLDYHNFVVGLAGPAGPSTIAKAKIMRDWALANKVMIVHALVDMNARPPPTMKGATRIEQMLAGLASQAELIDEPTELAATGAYKEVTVLKTPGIISALKSEGLPELLRINGIKSLIICGLSTSGAVLRTAVQATDDGYTVTVVEDSCADQVEGLHDTLMQKVLSSRAHVATAQEFLNEWARAKST